MSLLGNRSEVLEDTSKGVFEERIKSLNKPHEMIEAEVEIIKHKKPMTIKKQIVTDQFGHELFVGDYVAFIPPSNSWESNKIFVGQVIKICKKTARVKYTWYRSRDKFMDIETLREPRSLVKIFDINEFVKTSKLF